MPSAWAEGRRRGQLEGPCPGPHGQGRACHTLTPSGRRPSLSKPDLRLVFPDIYFSFF